MTKLMPGVKREDLAPADDPKEGRQIAEEAARRLRAAYGDRLQDVVLFGSWVRGQAHEESDIDLLVVLDEVADRASERDRIVDALFDVEADSKRAIEAFPVALADARERTRPFVKAALDEGVGLIRGRL
jgi:predicted nucleotidyltransferase